MVLLYGAAAALFTPLAFSTGLQLGEKGEISLSRTTTETTIGATAGLVMSTVLGSIPAIASRDLGLPIRAATQKFDEATRTLKPEKILELTPKGTRVGIDVYIKKLKESYKNISAEEYDRLTNTLTFRAKLFFGKSD